MTEKGIQDTQMKKSSALDREHVRVPYSALGPDRRTYTFVLEGSPHEAQHAAAEYQLVTAQWLSWLATVLM